MDILPYLYLAWPGLCKNYPRQFGHGRVSLPIYNSSANHALLAKYRIYIKPDQAFAKFYLKLHVAHMNKKLAQRGCVFTLDPRRDPRQDGLCDVDQFDDGKARPV